MQDYFRGYGSHNTHPESREYWHRAIDEYRPEAPKDGTVRLAPVFGIVCLLYNLSMSIFVNALHKIQDMCFLHIQRVCLWGALVRSALVFRKSDDASTPRGRPS